MTDHGTDCPCPDCEPPLTSGCLPPLLGLLVLVLAWMLIVAAGRAQDIDPTPLLLARTCVSERGWRFETDDCAAIYAVAVYQAGARAITPAAALRVLAPRLHGSAPIGRGWLRGLDLGGSRPDGLGAPWERVRAGGLPSRRDAWLATVEAARGIVAGTILSPCEAQPRAWGSTADLARRRAAGYRWIEVDCGDTVNHYGRLMRRREVDPE